MTISTVDSRTTYSGNDVTTAFAFPYKFLADVDIVVSITDALGVATAQTITTHYTVAGAGLDGGGTITMVTAPASTDTLVIYREVLITQETDYIEGDSFPANTHETALDRLTMICQQLFAKVNRSFRLADDAASNIDLVLPEPEAGKLIKINGDASALEYSDLSEFGIGISIQHERLTAAAGQTVFSLVNTYVLGANTISIYINGVRQAKGTEYTETTINSVTFVDGLNENDVVDLYVGVSQSTLAGQASAITYNGNTSVEVQLDAMTFESVAVMVAYSGLVVGMMVRTLGYYAAGDGGGNDYEIVAAATGTDDGGSYIDLAAHQAKGLFTSGVTSIDQFGAKSDWNGTTGTDNSITANNAFSFAADNRIPLTAKGAGYRFATSGIILKTGLTFYGTSGTLFVQDYDVDVEPKSESLFRNESWNNDTNTDEDINLSCFGIINGSTIVGGSFITINKCDNYTISDINIRKTSENTAMNIGGYGFKLDRISIKNLPADTGKIDGIHFEYIEDCTLSNLHIHSQDDCLGFAYFPAIIPPRSPAEAIANVEAGRDKTSRNIVVTNCTLSSEIASGIRIGNWANFDELNQWMMPAGRYENMTFSNIIITKTGATGGSIILEDFRTGAEIDAPNTELRFNNVVINDFASATNAMIVINGNKYTGGYDTYVNVGTDRNYNRIFFSNISGTHASAGQTVNANGVSNLHLSNFNVGRTVAGDNELITQLVDRVRIEDCEISSVALSGTSNTLFIRDFLELRVTGGKVTGTGLEVAAIRLDQPNLSSGGKVYVSDVILSGQVGGVHSVSALVLDEIQIDANVTGLSGSLRNANLTATIDDSAPLLNFHANVSGVTDNECRRNNGVVIATAIITVSATISAGQKIADFPAGAVPANNNAIKFQLLNPSGTEYQIDYSDAVGLRSQSSIVAGTYYLSLPYIVAR